MLTFLAVYFLVVLGHVVLANKETLTRQLDYILTMF